MRRRWLHAVIWCSMTACAPPPVPSWPTTTTPPPPPARAPAAHPVPSIHARATIHDIAGMKVGTATFDDTHGGVLVSATVTGLGLGAHAVHIHENGKCEPPFHSAGNHFNPGNKRHGFKSIDGFHAGDLPNIDMPAAGTLHFEFLMAGVTLRGTRGILGPTGASIVIHTAGDDYITNPAGNSGSPQACGVIVPR
jgi:superoxide dismutase, Cu-Zn family